MTVEAKVISKFLFKIYNYINRLFVIQDLDFFLSKWGHVDTTASRLTSQRGNLGIFLWGKWKWIELLIFNLKHKIQ